MGKLDGKAAIITGAGQGIGKGIALALAKEGAKIVIAEINKETCKASAAGIQELGGEAIAVVCDVGKEIDVKKMVDQAVKRFGPIDILVNNAQGYTPRVPAEEVEDEHWDYSFQTGVKAVWYCSKAVFPHMKGRGGKIINIASGAGVFGLENASVYSATKEAIRGFSKTLAKEWGKYRINVNIICPLAWTPASEAFAEMYPEEYKRSIETVPLGRWGDAEKDIGGVAVFLASEYSDYMTGQTLMVEGGANIF
jgi:NAD(P)-dependent dehydrogenase (short-subunit alcohol dehydrogenase family)